MTPLAPLNLLGYPAPIWFLKFFKVFGFSLHLVPMNVWYAGLPLIVILMLGRGHGRVLAGRLLKTMPVMIALGINFGIVPLLFTQVLIPHFYYPAGILIAWPWLSVIAWLALAYYGVYLFLNFGQRLVGRLAGWVSALAFLLIGFLFANNFSLMTDTARWLEIFDAAQVAGAPTGLALNLGDPTLIPRWLMMFGLALTTVAVLIVVDTSGFAGRESQEYRDWSLRFAVRLYALGLVWFGVAGSVYLFGAVDGAVLAAAGGRPPVLVLFALTAASPVLVWLLAIFRPGRSPKAAALLIGSAQYAALLLNAISRQWVQDVEIGGVFDPGSVAINFQWSPVVAFLVLFLAGLVLIFLLMRRALRPPLPGNGVRPTN